MIWLAIIVLSMVSAHSAAQVIVDVVILITFIALLTYASVIFHKQRKGTLHRQQQPIDQEAYFPQQHKTHSGYDTYDNVPSVHDHGQPAYGSNLPPYSGGYSNAPEPTGPAYYGPQVPSAGHESHELPQRYH